MENLDLKSSRSQIKILGTLVSISGALIVTLYKGPPIASLSTPSLSLSSKVSLPSQQPFSSNMLTTANNWVLGNCFIICCNMEHFSERDNMNAWKLRPDIEVISVIYSAVFGSVVTYSVQTWCINKKGPVFVAMFKPLGIAIAALMGIIFLGDALHVGSWSHCNCDRVLWSNMGTL
ncbi:unnamed protein product [Ilex paraguariensis]|uniref:WAT1-related protein n=1 Tax=Ilex paraguariensis TaxID=185542 RepID=A0ABC8TIV4_9AQUA